MGPDGLYVSTAAALVEKESGGKNVFGCDWGSQLTDSPPYCNVAVTAERVQRLIENYYQPPVGVGANGVGYTQLTTMALVERAQEEGGAHLPKLNMRVGFRYLNELIARFGWPAGAAAYNAGPGNWPSVINTYGADMAAKERVWANRLEGASDVTKEKPAKRPSEPVDTSGLLTAEEGTNFRKGLDYILPIIGRREYWVWSSGIVPDGEGMYAVNAPLPPVEQIGRINCAGVTNLFFRAMRKRIPTRGDPHYDGGVAAYAGGLFGPGYFEGYSEPFELGKAKRWAQETRCGVLLLRPYWNASLSGQGHVAILLPSGYVLQSFPNMHGPDLNWDYTIEQSSAGDYYTDMVHPENWSEYEDPEDDW